VSVEVVDVRAVDCHDLRRRVLRAGTPSDDVEFDEDARPDAFHLAAADADGRLVGVATFFLQPTPWRDGQRAAQLRGMAVEPTVQGQGVGAALLRAATDRLRSVGVTVLWANARDSALGFYERCGMVVVGDGFLTSDTLLPHHVVVLDLVS
jgi:GNAT superfamily N-acetyltransferase